jgi:hypothetical protein
VLLKINQLYVLGTRTVTVLRLKVMLKSIKFGPTGKDRAKARKALPVGSISITLKLFLA